MAIAAELTGDLDIGRIVRLRGPQDDLYSLGQRLGCGTCTQEGLKLLPSFGSQRDPRRKWRWHGRLPCRRNEIDSKVLIPLYAMIFASCPSQLALNKDLRNAVLVRRFVSPWPVMLAVFVDRVWASKAIARIFGVEG